MHILFLLPEFPYPPTTGGRSKIFNELSYLSSMHKCDLLCFGIEDKEQIKAMIEVLPNVTVRGVIPLPSGIMKWVKIALSLMRLLPPSLAKFSSNVYTNTLTKLLREHCYDVVHYDIVNMAQYLTASKGIASVHSPNDATSLSYSRMAKQESKILRKILLLMSAVLLKRFEKKQYPLFEKVHVVSPIDANYLNKINPGIDIDVIPITIDGAFLTKYEKSSSLLEEDVGVRTIICTGNFGNSSIARGLEEFLTHTYPLILTAFPKVRMLILGQSADESLMMLIKEAENVEFIAWVDSYRDFLVQADVVLAPDLAGTGIKTRVIQAMGIGLPVIGTKIAFEGIPIIEGTHGFVYQSSAECIDFFIRLLSNSAERKKVCESAHQLAKEKFALSAVGPRYENLYISALEKHKLIRHT